MATEARPLVGIRNRRVVLIVVLAAFVAAAAVVGITLLQTRGEHTTVPGAVIKPRAGNPPLLLDFGVRDGRQAQDLSRAAELLNAKHVVAARAIFERYHSLQARIGLAFANWPGNGLDTLQTLAAQNPDSPVAGYHLGWALYWSGRLADAVAAWKRVDTRFPDSPESVEAENQLYPADQPGLPDLVLPVTLPREQSRAAQLRVLAAAARRPDARAKLRYGDFLWQLWHRVSAERQFAAAARLAPHDPAARTAAAVALFSKRTPTRAFAKLGPLTAVFPHAPVVRFELGLLLIANAQPGKGLVQLRLAAAEAPHSSYAKAVRALLSSLRSHGTK
ncbi:MAG: tetratricopeptide repeat protein [Gaiellaceae bacterium]